jgi:uncharacterized membrane protein
MVMNLVRGRQAAPPTSRTRARQTPGAWQRGQNGVFFAAALPAIIAVVGLLVDGGRALWARRQAQVAADAAALAAAVEPDWARLLNANEVALPGDARSYGQSYGERNFPAASTSCTTDDLTAVCTTTITVPTTFLALFAVPALEIRAESTAELTYGIEEEGQ